MRCVSLLLTAFALVSGCGSSAQPGPLDGASATDGTSTTEPVDAMSSSGGLTSYDPPAWGDAGISCGPGREGCLCREDDTCDEGLLCDGNLCRWDVQCGDGRVDPPESCDDENVIAGDGCSSVCQWERHCLVGLVGDGQGTLRTVSFDSDGALQLEADRLLAAHELAPMSLGRSVRRCGARAFVASDASGRVQYVEGLGPPESPGLAVQGALELACAQTFGLLFVTVQTDTGFEVQLFDAAQGELVLLDVFMVAAEGVPRMAVDEMTDRLWLALPGTPLSLLPLGYADLELTPQRTVTVDLDVTHADDFLWLPSVAAGVVVSDDPDGQVVGVTEGSESWSGSNGPWADRSGAEPIGVPDFRGVFVMGGSTGAVRGRIDESGLLLGVGPQLVPDLEDTFVRTALDATRILVASSEEVRLLAPTSFQQGVNTWQELGRVSLPSGPRFESGAVIPCP